MEVNTEKKFIDVDEVLESKSPTLHKYMPGFLLKYLKRIVHQDQINDFIKRNGHRYEFDFVDAIVEEFGAIIDVTGTENIRTTGGVIFAANHPLGALDAISLLQVLGRYRKDVTFIVNDILLSLKNLRGIFIGVNKHGKNSKESMDAIDKLYASETSVLIFPAGLVSRKQDGIIRDLLWRKSFIAKSKQYKRDIIPIHIEAQNSPFFYRLAWLRKTLGIKANIEMLYLVDEMYKQKTKHISITIGKALPYQLFDDSHTDAEWSEKVKQHVYALVTKDQSKLLN